MQFPLQPIGRARKLADLVTDPPDFMKDNPDMAFELTFANLIGNNYSRNGKKIARLGHLKDLFTADAVNI